MDLRTVELDHADSDAFDRWNAAGSRGFLVKAADTDVERAERRQVLDGTTILGVYDDTAAEPLVPVATLGSFPTALTIPGGSVPAVAITEVTVSATHERRGIARSLLEGRLRHAHESGAAAAVLTASEATIYGRFGFAPASWEYTHEVDPRRVSWRGERPSGRVHTIDVRSLTEVAPALFTESRTAGDIDRTTGWWRQVLREVGIRHFDHGEGVTLALRYDDADGTPRGYALYRVDPAGAYGELIVDDVVTTTPEARYALWRHLTGISLTTKVTFHSASDEEAIRWRLVDRRAVSTTAHGDALWVRIVDVPAVLTARHYAAAAELVLDIADPYGYADGRFAVHIGDDGTATVDRIGDSTAAGEADAADEAHVVRLTVNDLGAILLGGSHVTALAEAGLLSGSSAAITALARAFATDRAPFLRTHF